MIIASIILRICKPNTYSQLDSAHVMKVHIKHYDMLITSDYYVLPCYKTTLENLDYVAKSPKVTI